MKKLFTNITGIVAVAAAAFTVTSCNWLDVSPDMGVDDSVVFSSYRNIKAYLDFVVSDSYKSTNIYNSFALYEESAGQKFSLENTTDASDGGRVNTSTTGYKKCNLTWDMVSKRNIQERPVSDAMWKVIRVANKTLANLDKINDCTEDEKNDMLGYCYFYRAYAHYVLCRKWGGVPYLDHYLGPDDEWDLERPSSWDTYQKAADDFYTAYEYLSKSNHMRCDPKPGKEGHLNPSAIQQMYPTGMRALAFRARVLVYAASPLNNEQGQKDWEEAADACAEALAAALEQEYSLVTLEEYPGLFLNQGLTEETFWVYQTKCKDNTADMAGWTAYPQSNHSGCSGSCPTQNFVDLYETRQGDPLDTEEARKEAQALGHYNPQNPYANIDPRFDITVVHDGTPNRNGGGNINIYKDSKGVWPTTKVNSSEREFGVEWGSRDNVTNGFSNTGYYINKYWDGNLGSKGSSHNHTDNLFRLAELYLLYAEAVNEAYGPNGKAGSCNLTAVDAINVIRNRVEMPDVQSRFTGDKDTFRKRIQNERMVEFAFEDYHYWCDIRRWKIAPQRMGAKIIGMYITECPKDAEHPNGKNYERRPIPESRQGTWKDCMYYYPFAQEQEQTMIKFKNNELWH